MRALPSHQCGPASIPGLGVFCGLSLLLVLIPALRILLSGYSSFPPSTKSNIPKFQFDLETVDEDPLRGCASEISRGNTNTLRPRLYGEKLSRVEGSLAYPSYPAGRANISYISLQNYKNLANRLHEKQNVGSAGRVTRLAGSPFFDGRVTLLAGPTFLLHINTVARLAGSTSPTRDNQSMHERCWLGQRGQRFSHINAR